MIHQLIWIQSDDAEKGIVIATFHGARERRTKRQRPRSRNVSLKKLRAKAQTGKSSAFGRGSALRLCAFAREMFSLL